METKPSSSRAVPAALLLAVLGVLALHHWYVVTEHSGFLLVMFLLPPFGMLALGGLVHPPILYSIGKYSQGMPAWKKAIGYALVVSGFLEGFLLFRFVYGF